MRLLDTHKRLPGGWRYKQPDANGKIIREWKGNYDPWYQFLGEILSCRIVNHLIRAEIHFVEADVTEHLAREFGGDPRYFTQDKGAQKKTSPSLRPRSRSGAGIAEAASSAFNAQDIIRDWLGDGLKPVPRPEAQARADICTGRLSGRPCPKNQPGSRLFGFAARRIQSFVERKNELKLEVEGETKLESCAVCLCDLKLKVHVPMPHILHGTPDSMLLKFDEQAPPDCWMRNRKP